MEEFELPQLTKLQTNIPKAEDIQWCGFLEQYDEQYDRITSRTERRLQASLVKSIEATSPLLSSSICHVLCSLGAIGRATVSACATAIRRIGWRCCFEQSMMW